MGVVKLHESSYMPWSYTIDPDRNVVMTKAVGIVTEDDLRLGAAKGYADPRFHPDLRAFLDYTDVTDWRVSTNFLTRMAANRRFSEKSKTAILAVGLLNFGMSRAYQAFADKGQVQIFTDRAEAVAWLNEGYPPEMHIT